MARAINEREALFIAYYQAPGETYQNATQSAIKAGYSAKSAVQIGSQLLHKPKIKTAIDNLIAKKREEITKESYVDMALKDYRALDTNEPNKPRFLDIAGKALGYIGNNQDQKLGGNTLNLTQINITGAETQEQLWEITRKLLGND